MLTATAETFGLDLNLTNTGSSPGSRGFSENLPSSSAPLGTPGRASSSSREGRRAFHKMARIMVQGLRNESSDVWELGAEAARLWPFYRNMVEDGCGERFFVSICMLWLLFRNVLIIIYHNKVLYNT